MLAGARLRQQLMMVFLCLFIIMIVSLAAATIVVIMFISQGVGDVVRIVVSAICGVISLATICVMIRAFFVCRSPLDEPGNPIRETIVIKADQNQLFYKSSVGARHVRRTTAPWSKFTKFFSN